MISHDNPPTVASILLAAARQEAGMHKSVQPLEWEPWHAIHEWTADTTPNGRRLERSFTLLESCEISRPAGLFFAERLSDPPFLAVWATDSKSRMAAHGLWVIVTYCEGDLTIEYCTDEADFHAAYDLAADYYLRHQ